MDTTSSKQFGLLLKQYRYLKGISQVELAFQITYSPSMISRWESLRDKPPTREIVAQIGRTLNLTTEELDELLLAAGYAPVSPSTSGLSPEIKLSPVLLL